MGRAFSAAAERTPHQLRELDLPTPGGGDAGRWLCRYWSVHWSLNGCGSDEHSPPRDSAPRFSLTMPLWHRRVSRSNPGLGLFDGESAAAGWGSRKKWSGGGTLLAGLRGGQVRLPWDVESFAAVDRFVPVK
jgi:hypothetical protein